MNLPDYGLDKVIDGSTVNATATVTASWLPCLADHEFTFWVKATSTSGTADVKLDVDQSPITDTFATGDPILTTTVDASDTSEDWVAYTNTTVNATVAAQYRVKVTGNAGNPADTVATVYVSKRSK